MKKIFQSVIFLLFAGRISLRTQAQVSIGSQENPHERAGRTLQMKKMFLVLTAEALVSVFVPDCLFAGNEIEYGSKNVSFSKVTVKDTPIAFFNDKEINGDILYLNARISAYGEGGEAQEMMTVLYQGDIWRSATAKSAIPLEGMTITPISPILKSSASEDPYAPASKAVRIDFENKVTVLKSAQAESLFLVWESATENYFTFPIATDFQYHDMSLNWDKLLVWNPADPDKVENRSLSRKTIFVRAASVPDGYPDVTFQLTNFRPFAPSLLYYDTEKPGEETFSSINVFPVWDAMVVYIKENRDNGFGNPTNNYRFINSADYFKDQKDLSDIVYWNYVEYPNLIGKIITTVSDTAVLKDDPRLVHDEGFGNVLAYQDTNKETKLSMSTDGLKPGFYSRFILWRRGLKTADNKVDKVGYINDGEEADVFAVVEYVTVEAKTPGAIEDTKAGNNNVEAFSNAPGQVTVTNADEFIGSGAILRTATGVVLNQVKLEKGMATIDKAVTGVTILELNKKGTAPYVTKVIVK